MILLVDYLLNDHVWYQAFVDLVEEKLLVDTESLGVAYSNVYNRHCKVCAVETPLEEKMR